MFELDRILMLDLDNTETTSCLNSSKPLFYNPHLLFILNTKSLY